jgi:beta-phosphoglucomutase-like phosphatase (HAD superfamily)
LPICVASSSSTPEQIRQKLKMIGLLGRFGERLFSATMVARGKPAPDLFLYAAQQLTTAPDRCLVIEDSPAGIDAALAAGMTAIGFCGGSHCGPEHGAQLENTERWWSLMICVRSLLGISGRSVAPTYEGLYSGSWQHPRCSRSFVA